MKGNSTRMLWPSLLDGLQDRKVQMRGILGNPSCSRCAFSVSFGFAGLFVGLGLYSGIFQLQKAWNTSVYVVTHADLDSALQAGTLGTMLFTHMSHSSKRERHSAPMCSHSVAHICSIMPSQPLLLWIRRRRRLAQTCEKVGAGQYISSQMGVSSPDQKNRECCFRMAKIPEDNAGWIETLS